MRVIRSFCCGLFVVMLASIMLGCKESKIYDHRGQLVVLQPGKWQLINYWATWCHACLQEMPDFVALQAQYPKQVQVIGASFDHLSTDELQKLAEQYQINFPLLSDLDYTQWGVRSIQTVPTTLVINPEGKLERIERLPRTLAQWQNLLHLDAKEE